MICIVRNAAGLIIKVPNIKDQKKKQGGVMMLLSETPPVKNTGSCKKSACILQMMFSVLPDRGESHLPDSKNILQDEYR